MFSQHINSKYEDIKENCIWLMCHLAAENPTCRSAILNSNIFDIITNSLMQNENSLENILITMWLLSNLFDIKKAAANPNHDLEQIKTVLNFFTGYLYINDENLSFHCLTGIFNLSQIDNLDICQLIINSGAVLKIIKINYNKLHKCVLPSIRIFGNLTGGINSTVDVILRY